MSSCKYSQYGCHPSAGVISKSTCTVRHRKSVPKYGVWGEGVTSKHFFRKLSVRVVYVPHSRTETFNARCSNTRSRILHCFEGLL